MRQILRRSRRKAGCRVEARPLSVAWYAAAESVIMHKWLNRLAAGNERGRIVQPGFDSGPTGAYERKSGNGSFDLCQHERGVVRGQHPQKSGETVGGVGALL